MTHNDQNNLEEIDRPTEDPSLKPAVKKVSQKISGSEDPSSVSCGSILKEARQGQGLSLETVHEATKIPLDALRAIEEGYKIRSLSPFYYNGFVKIYAGFLGLDPSNVLGSQPDRVIVRSSDNDVNFVDFDLVGRFRSFFTRRRKKQLLIACGVLLGFFLVFKAAAAVSAWIKRPKTEKKIVKIEKKTTAAVKPSVVENAVKKTEPPAPKPSAKAVEPAVAAVSAPSAKAQKNVVLTVRASKKSWLRVTSDGAVVFQANLNEGAVETWQANNNIEISGSNLNLLEFELNGKLIGKLGRKDRKAKAVVITKDGLSVK